MFAKGRSGVDALKKEQDQSFRAVLYGSNDLISLPTGYGKSYFAMLPLVYDPLRQREILYPSVRDSATGT